MLRPFVFALTLALALGLAGSAVAQDLGSQAPLKTPGSYPQNVPSPLRQGGDTIETATVIPALPFHDTGTTAGYVNDYDEVCPYTYSDAPDVVYRYVAPHTQPVAIDLCGSGYDTKVYVYDGDLNVIDCNDDYYTGGPCGQYVSRLENVVLVAGTTYYVVVDGYTGASGPYVLDIVVFEPCVWECPAGAIAEGEPPIVDDYVDNYNSGCGGINTPYQVLAGDEDGDLTFCGASGWFTSSGGHSRDTDWFILHAGVGNIELTADAEYATYMFELGPQDCATVMVVQQITAGPCAPATMTIAGYAPDAPVWFWAGPTVFAPPSGADTMYDYAVWFSGLAPGPVATEASVWGAVKSLWE